MIFPSAQKGLQRPGVVWFGEDLDEAMLDRADEFCRSKPLVSTVKF